MQALMSEARVWPEPDDRLARFRVVEPLAVLACLRALRNEDAPVTLHAEPGARDACAIGRIVAVNAPVDRIEIAAGGQDARLAALARLAQATAVAFADRVKIQFVLSGLACVADADGGVRLRALVPPTLYRVQRRDAFRVRPAWRARCTVPQPGGRPALSATVLDASVGGVSLGWTAPEAPRVGARLEDCQLALPGLSEFRCDLLVRSVGEPAPDAEPGTLRVGCAFEALSGPMQRTLQRFVFDTDKRHLMRLRAARAGAGAAPDGPTRSCS